MGSRLMVRVRWLVVALTLAPAGVRADDTELARAHFARGKQQYDAGKFTDAIRSFRAAAAIQGSPLLDYNIGRCQEKLGQIDEAIASYERYLAGKPDATNRAEVRAKLAELKKRKAAGVPKDPYEELEKRPPPASAPAAPAAGAAEEPGAPRAATPARVPPRAAARATAPEDPPHEASLPQSYAPVARPAAPSRVAGAMPAPSPPPRPVAPRRRDDGPFYKQWWFWVAVAGGAVIAGFVIGVAASGSGDVPSKTSGLEVRF